MRYDRVSVIVDTAYGCDYGSDKVGNVEEWEWLRRMGESICREAEARQCTAVMVTKGKNDVPVPTRAKRVDDACAEAVNAGRVPVVVLLYMNETNGPEFTVKTNNRTLNSSISSTISELGHACKTATSAFIDGMMKSISKDHKRCAAISVNMKDQERLESTDYVLEVKNTLLCAIMSYINTL